MLAVDTNVIVRLLTGDDARQFPRAKALMDSHQVFVPLTVILETDWVLRSNFGYGAREVAEALRAFCGLPQVTIEGGSAVFAALGLAEAGVDFTDALHLSMSLHCSSLATFDRRFVKFAHAAGFDQVVEA